MPVYNGPREKYRLKQIGKICHDCGVYFKKEHGHPVICKSCANWRKTGGRPIDLPIAIYPEIGVEDLTPAERFSILGDNGESRIEQRKRIGTNHRAYETERNKQEWQRAILGG